MYIYNHILTIYHNIRLLHHRSCAERTAHHLGCIFGAVLCCDPGGCRVPVLCVHRVLRSQEGTEVRQEGDDPWIAVIHTRGHPDLKVVK